MSGPTSLQEFLHHSIWPYIVICIVYVTVKYVILSCVLVFLCKKKKQTENQTSPESSTSNEQSRKSTVMKCAHMLVHHTVLNDTPVRLLSSEAMESNVDKELKVYLHGKEVSDEHVIIMCVHVISLIATMLVIVVKMFWTNIVTYACSTHEGIHCFPQIIHENDSHLIPNISLESRINDCAIWNQESFADRIAFICFEITHSIEGAIVAIGGVTALFSPTMKVIVFIFKRLYKSKCARNKKCRKAIDWIQLIIGLALIPVDLSLVILLVVFASIASPVDEFFMKCTFEYNTYMFVISHGIIMFFILEIVHTSFFFPWDIYVSTE